MSQNPPQPPLAETVSVEARAALAPFLAAADMPMPELDVAQMRQMSELLSQPIIAARLARYGVGYSEEAMGGVPVRLVHKPDGAIDPAGPLLINFHGGGFQIDAGSLAETLPIAGLTGLPVVAVRYRLAPEHAFPAAVEDALAVYKAALETRPATRIAVFGTSAGAALSAQLVARLLREGLPLPAAVGFFSGSADFVQTGDIEAYLPRLMPGKSAPEVVAPYVGGADRSDPLLSPLFGELAGFPPTLLMSSTRDLLLSQTVRFHLALREAGVAAELLVYEGLPHAFWAYAECPETDQALAAQATFLARHV
jgi:epsilon-lactone hydrolase